MLIISVLYYLATLAHSSSIIADLQSAKNTSCSENEDSDLSSTDEGVHSDIRLNNANWILKQSSDLRVGPVLDDRWKEFNVLQGISQTFKTSASISFSIYSPSEGTEIHFFIGDGTQTKRTIFVPAPKCQWTHHTIISIRDQTFLINKGEIVWSMDGVHPRSFIVTTNVTTLWKIHNYEVYLSNKIVEEPMRLAIPRQTYQLIIHVAMCETCSLTVIVSDCNGIMEHVLNSANTIPNVYSSWISRTISIEPDEETLVSVFTGKRLLEEKGFWAANVIARHKDLGTSTATTASGPIIFLIAVYLLTAWFSLE